MRKRIMNIFMLFFLLLTVQNIASSQSILSNRTYPYITLDDQDSVVVVLSPAQYDGVVTLIQKDKYKTKQLNNLDSAFVALEALLTNTNNEVQLYKQKNFLSEVKFQTMEDLYRISSNNYSDVVKKNIELETKLKIMTNNRDKWRAGVMAGVVVTVVYAVIRYNSN